MTVPEVSIDPAAFHADPYPILAQIQETSPVTYVRHLDAYLITRRDDVAEWERRTHILSSDQPGGLMTVLMGQNMMRKDGAAHQAERRAIFPTISPKTVRDHWAAQFKTATRTVLRRIAPHGKCDLVADYAMPVSAEALKLITGLADMPWQRMDAVSQAMIDGCANYADDPAVTTRCHTATAEIDHHITITKNPDPLSLLGVQHAAELSPEQISANIKLAISVGQN
jgi:cytochrome P450